MVEKVESVNLKEKTRKRRTKNKLKTEK